MKASMIISSNRSFIIAVTIAGGLLGLLYSILEYSLSNRPFLILLVLGLSIGLLIGISVSLFETLTSLLFKQRTFIEAVLIRTVIYLGINGKMNEISAAAGITSIDSLDKFIKIASGDQL